MAHKDSAREAVLDAFESVVIDRGERAATVGAVAAAAGVSKGGLLYHFSSKNDLVDGLVERMSRLGEDDRASLRGAPEGIVRRFLTTSAVVAGTPFDTTYIAITRLAQSGLYPAASTALGAVEREWRTLIENTVGDPAVAHLILLVSDGLYYNAGLMPSAETRAVIPSELAAVIDAVEDLVRARTNPT